MQQYQRLVIDACNAQNQLNLGQNILMLIFSWFPGDVFSMTQRSGDGWIDSNILTVNVI